MVAAETGSTQSTPGRALRVPGTVGVILAAGEGTRIGSGRKAFLRLDGVPLYRIAVDLLSPHVERVLVGVPPALVDEARDELASMAEVSAGGKTRFETIVGLAERCPEETVVLHDAARPFAPSSLVAAVVAAARTSEAVVAAVLSPGRHVRATGDRLVEVIAKTEGHTLQTPQAYRRRLLLLAAERAARDGLPDLTPSEVVLRLGVPVYVVAGEFWNFKITTARDWSAAQLLAPLARQAWAAR